MRKEGNAELKGWVVWGGGGSREGHIGEEDGPKKGRLILKNKNTVN